VARPSLPGWVEREGMWPVLASWDGGERENVVHSSLPGWWEKEEYGPF